MTPNVINSVCANKQKTKKKLCCKVITEHLSFKIFSTVLVWLLNLLLSENNDFFSHFDLTIEIFENYFATFQLIF